MDAPIPDYASNVPDMLNNTWLTEPGFKYTLNEGYNDIASDLLDWIFPKYKDFKGYQLNPEDLLDFGQMDGNDVIWDNSGPVGYIAVGLLFIIFMLLAGIGWCVIKFCCCCLRSSDDSDEESMVGDESSKREKFARISCGIGLAIWILFLSFGLFGLFVANEQIHTAISDLPKDIDNALHDVELYRNTTVDQINAIFIDSYEEFSVALLETIPEIGRSNEYLSVEFDKIMEDLNTALEKASKIEDKFENSETVFSESKTRILELFGKCDTNFCQDVRQSGLESMKMSPSYQTLKSFLNPKISEFISEVIQTVRVDSPISDKVKEWLADTGVKLLENAVLLTDALREIPISDIRSDIEDIDAEMERWVSVLYYIVLFACIFLLAIPVVLLVGAIFGCLGGRSRKSCINRRRGASFMNCGLFSIFLTAWLFWILAIAVFTFSGVLTQIVCEAVRDLENDNSSTTVGTTESPLARIAQMKLQSKLDSFSLNRAEDEYKLPTYGEIVRACKRGSGAYETFELETAYDVTEIFDLLTLPDFQNLTNSLATRSIRKIDAANGLSKNLAKIAEEVKRIEEHFEKSTEPTVMNLATLRQLAKDPGAHQIENDMEAEIKKLEDTQGHLSASIQKEVKSLGQTIQGVLNIIPKLAEIYLVEGEVFSNIMDRGNATDQVLKYTDFIFEQISYNVGNCQPMYTALDTTIELFCYKIAAPVSSFWFSLTLILLLFIPIIITAILLEKLYRRR